jgi:hypothetical protein
MLWRDDSGVWLVEREAAAQRLLRAEEVDAECQRLPGQRLPPQRARVGRE